MYDLKMFYDNLDDYDSVAEANEEFQRILNHAWEHANIPFEHATHKDRLHPCKRSVVLRTEPKWLDEDAADDEPPGYEDEYEEEYEDEDEGKRPRSENDDGSGVPNHKRRRMEDSKPIDE